MEIYTMGRLHWCHAEGRGRGEKPFFHSIKDKPKAGGREGSKSKKWSAQKRDAL